MEIHSCWGLPVSLQEDYWFTDLDMHFKHMAIDLWIGKTCDNEGWWEHWWAAYTQMHTQLLLSNCESLWHEYGTVKVGPSQDSTPWTSSAFLPFFLSLFHLMQSGIRSTQILAYFHLHALHATDLFFWVKSVTIQSPPWGQFGHHVDCPPLHHTFVSTGPVAWQKHLPTWMCFWDKLPPSCDKMVHTHCRRRNQVKLHPSSGKMSPTCAVCYPWQTAPIQWQNAPPPICAVLHGNLPRPVAKWLSLQNSEPFCL